MHSSKYVRERREREQRDFTCPPLLMRDSPQLTFKSTDFHYRRMRHRVSATSEWVYTATELYTRLVPSIKIQYPYVAVVVYGLQRLSPTNASGPSESPSITHDAYYSTHQARTSIHLLSDIGLPSIRPCMNDREQFQGPLGCPLATVAAPSVGMG